MQFRDLHVRFRCDLFVFAIRYNTPRLQSPYHDGPSAAGKMTDDMVALLKEEQVVAVGKKEYRETAFGQAERCWQAREGHL